MKIKIVHHLVALLFLSLFASCMTNRDGNGPIVKVYVSKPEQGGLVRAQENEIVKYEESANYRCLNKEDFDALINYCFNPKPENVFEKIREKIRKIPSKNQDTAIKATTRNFMDTTINMKGEVNDN